MRTKPIKKHLTFNIDESLAKELESYCIKERRTKSSAIELAIELLLKSNTSKEDK